MAVTKSGSATRKRLPFRLPRRWASFAVAVLATRRRLTSITTTSNITASAAPGAGADRCEGHAHGGKLKEIDRDAERQRTRRRLEAYCAMDTQAMVEIVAALRGVVRSDPQGQSSPGMPRLGACH